MLNMLNTCGILDQHWGKNGEGWQLGAVQLVKALIRRPEAPGQNPNSEK